MEFRSRNGHVVTLSPADSRRLLEEARASGNPNAVSVIECPSPVKLADVPVTTGDEIVDSVLAVERPLGNQLRRLQPELKIEYSVPFVHRGLVSEQDDSGSAEFAGAA